VLRPSGTEPDLKLYLSADGADASACRTRLDDLTNVFSGGVGMPPSKAY